MLEVRDPALLGSCGPMQLHVLWAHLHIIHLLSTRRNAPGRCRILSAPNLALPTTASPPTASPHSHTGGLYFPTPTRFTSFPEVLCGISDAFAWLVHFSKIGVFFFPSSSNPQALS